MHQKFPLLLWPLFQLQDRMQSRSLGRAAWTTIGRRDAKMRQVNQTMLRSKDAALAAAPGLARGDLSDLTPGTATASAGTSGVGAGSVRSVVAASGELSPGDIVSPKAVTPGKMLAPGQRLAGGAMSGLAIKSVSTSKSIGKSHSKSGGKSSSTAGRRR